MSLSLRCTDAMLPLAPPPIEAFRAGARLVDPGRDKLLAWSAPLGTLVEGTTLLHRCAPLPAPHASRRMPRFPLSPRVAAAALALPLSLAPLSLRAEEIEETEETEAQEGADAEAAPSAAESKGASPLPTAPAEDQAPSLLFTDVVVWDALRGARVRVRLDNELLITGRVLTQVQDEIALAREPDGTVMRIPKGLILGVRMLEGPVSAGDPTPSPAARPPKSGRGAATAGGILVGVGASLMTTFALGVAFDSSFAYYAFPLPWLGSILISPGIPLLAVGLARENERQLLKLDSMELRTGPTMGGWSGSLSIRF